MRPGASEGGPTDALCGVLLRVELLDETVGQHEHVQLVTAAVCITDATEAK